MRNEENAGFKFPMRAIENEAIMILPYVFPISSPKCFQHHKMIVFVIRHAMECIKIRLIVQKFCQRSYVMNLSALCNVIKKNACTKLLTTCNRHARLSDCNKAVTTLLHLVCCKLFSLFQTCGQLETNSAKTTC